MKRTLVALSAFAVTAFLLTGCTPTEQPTNNGENVQLGQNVPLGPVKAELAYFGLVEKQAEVLDVEWSATVKAGVFKFERQVCAASDGYTDLNAVANAVEISTVPVDKALLQYAFDNITPELCQASNSR